MSLIRIWGVMFPMVAFLSGITILILLLFGGRAVMEGRISPGDFAAFLAYLNMLVWPMVGAGVTVNMIQRGSASLGRINRIFETKADITSPAKPLSGFSEGRIEIRNLTYRYPDSDAPESDSATPAGGAAVLDGISLEIPPGTILGVLGRTGSGKSTLAKLLPRLLDPPEGTVFLDGHDVRSYDLQSLRSRMGVVLQDPFLFSTSIRANIGFGKKEMEAQLVRRMADISTISRDLKLFPEGLETMVGERGITLSGGQKQRITLSRALAIDPRILILDDAFSSVDTETEDSILKDLARYFAGRTVLIVSHRISTLKASDLIVVLEHGKITQRGTHEELIREEGFYREIYNIQQLADTGGRGVSP
jgi:ATP-binding cassette subfamily B protein